MPPSPFLTFMRGSPFRRWAHRGRAFILLVICVLWAAPSGAGHELPFSPSYYPQEIRIQTLLPAAAVPLLKSAGLHAYVGADPLAGGRAPADLKPVESLGGYVVVTFNPGSQAAANRESRCAAARRIAKSLGQVPGLYVPHPYPVTPYDIDYLEHFDLAQSAKQAYAAAPAGSGAEIGRAHV